MPQVRFKLKSASAPQKFSDAFKKQVVQEFEKGRLNKMQLQAKYGLKGDNTVLKWCRKFGKFDYSSRNGRPMKDSQLQKIKELEKKLKDAELKLRVYDKLIEVTNRELGVDTILPRFPYRPDIRTLYCRKIVEVARDPMKPIKIIC